MGWVDSSFSLDTRCPVAIRVAVWSWFCKPGVPGEIWGCWAPTSIPTLDVGSHPEGSVWKSKQRAQGGKGMHPRTAGLPRVPAYLLDSPEGESSSSSSSSSSLYPAGVRVLGCLTCFVLGFLALLTSSHKETIPHHHLHFHLQQT